MSDWSRRIPFKVDVSGVIHVMGTALYSRPEAAVRELIQNSHDAIMRRRQQDLSYQGRIEVRQFPETKVVEFRDDGYGLNADEAERYLGTLGIGVTGILKGVHPSSEAGVKNENDLIGMFGIGLFSAFMLADTIVVESRSFNGAEAICWKAGEGTDIELSSGTRESFGTTVRLHLKPQHHSLAEDSESIEKIIKEYADFLTVPIFLNEASTRVNYIQASWFDPTPDRESIELDLAAYFEESPLDVIPVQITDPLPIWGALYVTPRRTPGFSGDSLITATILRMVVSRDVHGLLPEWASFLRGVLELRTCAPTASREDLVRNAAFESARKRLESYLYDHFEQLARKDAARFEAVLSWHRYSWSGAALSESRLRALLRKTYKFPTSRGLMVFDEILRCSEANPLIETEFDRIVWYNTDSRQEAWINTLFAEHDSPCIHATRSFEESLLATMIGDVTDQRVDLRFASPGATGFAEEILNVTDLEDAPAEWCAHLDSLDAKIRCARFRSDQPVMAFLNERHELVRTFEDLKKQGTVPASFQRLIDAHFDENGTPRNEVLLNRDNRLVARALEQKTNSPLASVLRLLVTNALATAGVSIPREAHLCQVEDLDWIAECLWGSK